MAACTFPAGQTARTLLLCALVNASSPHVVSPFELTIRVDLEAPAKRRGAARWPVLVCAVVALVAGAAAFTEGPLATHPTCAPYATALRVRAVQAVDLGRALARDLRGRAAR